MLIEWGSSEKESEMQGNEKVVSEGAKLYVELVAGCSY